LASRRIAGQDRRADIGAGAGAGKGEVALFSHKPFFGDLLFCGLFFRQLHHPIVRLYNYRTIKPPSGTRREHWPG
jgi:hypothetical protein